MRARGIIKIMKEMRLVVCAVLVIAFAQLHPADACYYDEYTCNNGQCVTSVSYCDDWPDCNDGSDEIGCGSCSLFEFRCTSGYCVNSDARCDGYSNCIDGSDEEGCAVSTATVATTSNCFSFQFACDDGDCVSSSSRCDGDNDCGDGSDEISCSSSVATGIGVGASIGGIVLFVIPIIICVVIIRAASIRQSPRRTVVSPCTSASTTAYIITSRRTTYQRVPTFNPDAPPSYTPQDMESGCPPPSQELPSQEPPPAYPQADDYHPVPQTF